MSNRVLEIGAGTWPAISDPGKLLQNPEVDFFALDARLDAIRRARLSQPAGVLMAAEAAELPFPDQTFSHVIMRSVFGEYTMPPAHTGSSLDAACYGLYEAFRVLRNGGQIVIAEENTPYPPASPEQIGNILYSAGFEDITYLPCQDMDNHDWWQERTKFWAIGEWKRFGNSRRRLGEPIDSRAGFLMTAGRHNVKMESFQAEITNKKTWLEAKKNNFRSLENRPMTRKINLKQAILAMPDEPEPYDDTYSHVTVKAKEGKYTLGEYRGLRVAAAD